MGKVNYSELSKKREKLSKKYFDDFAANLKEEKLVKEILKLAYEHGFEDGYYEAREVERDLSHIEGIN